RAGQGRGGGGRGGQGAGAPGGGRARQSNTRDTEGPRRMTTGKRGGLALTAALATGAVALTAMPCEAQAALLRVCADPGNMPLSNSRGEGFENKIARVLARALDTGLENYYRPGVERGLTRTTLDADQCDL